MLTKINNTTYGEQLNVSETRKIEYEIGDNKQVQFYPQFKTMHWNNECNFSVRLVDDLSGSVIEDGNIIKYVKSDLEVHFYEKAGDENGRFEFEIILKSKPVSNILDFTIQSKGLNFFYQPALTQEEMDKGTNRPDNVVGSYAVYHSSKRNNRVGEQEYRTGKAFHIYRPFAADANSKTTWCDLNIDNGAMTITIPQKFLDNAVYPIKVDPTFGYTTGGGDESC